MADTTKPNHDAVEHTGTALMVLGLVKGTFLMVLGVVSGARPDYGRVIGALIADLLLAGLVTWALAWFSPTRWKPWHYVAVAIGASLFFTFVSWSGNQGSSGI